MLLPALCDQFGIQNLLAELIKVEETRHEHIRNWIKYKGISNYPWVICLYYMYIFVHAYTQYMRALGTARLSFYALPLTGCVSTLDIPGFQLHNCKIEIE